VQRGESAAAPAQTRRGGEGRGLTRDDAGWEAQLAQLGKYRRKHGDCNVPQRWTEDPGLGRWVNNQRHHMKALGRGEPSEGMTAARAAKLTALGFGWQNSKANWDNAGWEAQLAKLKAHKQKHGGCCVPLRWPEDPKLGRWVKEQRMYKKKLDRGDLRPQITAARVAKLEALGFAWALSAAVVSKRNSEGRRDDAGWAAQLAKLKKYQRKHGDCSVPGRWAEDPVLGRWVDSQRKFKRKLDRGEPCEGMTAERAARLTAVGLVWDPPNTGGTPKEAGWEAQLARLATYKAAHGDCNVPRRWAENPRLGKWADSQRHRKKLLDRGEPSQGMTAARAAKLEALGFNWAPGKGSAPRGGRR
jgi:hypothetical protein